MSAKTPILLIVLAGCFDLPAVATGVCGNGIVEPGEDCDSFPDPMLGSGLTCNSSCRYTCTTTADCPDGWACGIDQICRHGVGTFAVAGPVLMPAATLSSAPLDGDGRVQAIGAGGGTLEVLRTENLTTSSLRVGGATLAAARDLTNSGRASLVTSDATAVVGWNTDLGGGFQPMLAIVQVPPSLATSAGVRFLPMQTAVSTDNDVAFVLLQPTPSSLLLTTQYALSTAAMPPVPFAITGISGALTSLVPPAIGTVVAGTPEIATLGFAGAQDITIVSTNATPATKCGETGMCWSAVGGVGETDAPSLTLPLPIGAARVLGDAAGDPMVFGDVDGDGYTDLIIPITNATIVANGDSAGHFAFDLAKTANETKIFLLDATTQRSPCSDVTYGSTVNYPPLLAAQLNPVADHYTDYVDQEGIILGEPGNTYCRAAFAQNATAAVTLDANDDGRTDVALIDGGIVVLYTQSPNSEFDAHLIAIPDGAIATAVEVAEVDGDYFDDIIIHATGIGATSEVWIAHGATDVTQIAVTSGPDVSTAQTFAAGSFQHDTGSAGGLVVYGHDAVTNTDYTAAVGTTPGGLGSLLNFITENSLELAFDVQLGRFLPGGSPDTLDLLVLRGKSSPTPVFDVWPNQGGVLRDIGHLSGPADATLAATHDGVRVYGDIDGDGIDEVCALVDDGTATTFTCDDLTLVDGDVGTSVTRTIMLAGYRMPVAAQLVDVDGDGHLDLVAAFAGVTGSSGGVIVVNDVAGAANIGVITTTAALGAIAVNMDADPALEIAAITDAIHLYKLTASGVVELGAIDDGPYTGVIATSDLDGDGVRELIVGQTDASVLVLWPATNTGPAR